MNFLLAIKSQNYLDYNAVNFSKNIHCEISYDRETNENI